MMVCYMSRLKRGTQEWSATVLRGLGGGLRPASEVIAEMIG
jgi:hypothetical protein